MKDNEFKKLLDDLARTASQHIKSRDMKQELAKVLYPAIRQIEQDAKGKSS